MSCTISATWSQRNRPWDPGNPWATCENQKQCAYLNSWMDFMKNISNSWMRSGSTPIIWKPPNCSVKNFCSWGLTKQSSATSVHIHPPTQSLEGSSPLQTCLCSNFILSSLCPFQSLGPPKNRGFLLKRKKNDSLEWWSIRNLEWWPIWQPREGERRSQSQNSIITFQIPSRKTVESSETLLAENQNTNNTRCCLLLVFK